MTTAEDIIAALELVPHPEGGHYRETFRDANGHGGRAHATAIYFLLAAGERSHWHSVDAVEMWHWYAGAPRELSVWTQSGGLRVHRLGPDVLAGERPQAAVPAHAWQSALSLGAWSLLGCTVAPGFDFAGFTLAPRDWTPPVR
jgi:predicted cupin superfamily sugar epimerase